MTPRTEAIVSGTPDLTRTEMTEAGRAFVLDSARNEFLASAAEIRLIVRAIEDQAHADGFALGKRLAEAHGQHGWRGVADKCPYDLDSLQPDGYHLFQTDQTITTDGLTTRLTAAVQTRVKCAGAA